MLIALIQSSYYLFLANNKLGFDYCTKIGCEGQSVVGSALLGVLYFRGNEY